MRKKARISILSAAILASFSSHADIVAHFSMDVKDGRIEETVSGDKFEVEGNFVPENVAGAVGKALRFDGYTSHIKGVLGDILPTGCRKMTVSAWVAVPCYPIIQLDTDTSEKTAILSCLDDKNKTGFGFYLGFDGKYSFRMFIDGWPVSIDVDSPLPTYCWNNLVAVVDCDSKTAILYNNGEEAGRSKVNGSISFEASDIYMGQGEESRMSGPFQLMSFNGLIDDISVWDEALEVGEIQGVVPENEPDLDIPASRFADDILRPRFHGMPAAGWTNECHGMYYSDGRYHLFFQKNGDGPYMARLHWGHISSENLYDWREEKIALAPGEWYDIKGCWSGCVFSDDVITGGVPNAIYTAVDYSKAMIAQAAPEDESLDNWTKLGSNPIISGRPSGLSDDIRDPYFFRDGDNAYIIVGTSKDGVGAATLHRYDVSSGRWSNNGDMFYTGTSLSQDGRFWEMPNITRMPDGRWLFTATPLETMQGVRTLYWVGNISSEGKFVPDPDFSTPGLVEMNSKEGFGMLSPTIYQHDGKTIVLGIVPDKLGSVTNWNLGWAHCYSLPREWSLAGDGTLLQKPYEGLSGLRTSVMYAREGFDLEGSEDLSPVEGRSVELCGVFEVGSSPFGFRIFKNGSSSADITYDPASGELVADFSRIQRLVNDGGVYDGVYRCPLQEKPKSGDDLKINVFIDHSILDIFVNDRYATSIRVFPTDSDADGIEAYALSPVKVKDLKAWILDVDSGSSGINQVYGDNGSGGAKKVDVYNLSGIRLRSQVDSGSATEGLPAGIYIVGGRKVIVDSI